ncbi:MAG: hypothetical protein ACFFCS_06710 [Candidatus Hodarchaeota archaeon]
MEKTCTNNNKRNGFLVWLGGISLCCSLVGMATLVPVVVSIDEQNGYYGMPVFPLFITYGIVTMIIAIIGVILGVRAREGAFNNLRTW